MTKGVSAAIVLVLPLAVMACGSDPVVLPPPSPTAPSTGPAFQPQATLLLPGPGVTLSGRVLEVTPEGARRPTNVRQLRINVEVSDPSDPNGGGWAPVDVDGRYRVTGVLDGRYVWIGAVTMNTIGPSSHRRCSMNTTMRGDTELDVPLFLPGADLPTPTLSGQVFRIVDGTRTPVAGVAVFYESRGHLDMWENTDSDGRYTLCGIPPIPGTLSMYCGHDEAVSVALDIRANHVIDIDATKIYECLVPIR